MHSALNLVARDLDNQEQLEDPSTWLMIRHQCFSRLSVYFPAIAFLFCILLHEVKLEQFNKILEVTYLNLQYTIDC